MKTRLDLGVSPECCSYVTHLQTELGFDVSFVQMQLGHEHASTTGIYTIAAPDYRSRELHRVLSATPERSGATLPSSTALLAIARERCGASPAYLDRDICDLSVEERFDAIICRGVLNDLVTETERQLALDSFARTLLPNGLLVIDVREAAASELRADGRPRQVEVLLPDGRQLEFTSTPSWREGRICVEEAYDLSTPGRAGTSHRYSFQMKPWTAEELHEKLEHSGFDRITIQPGVGRRVPDRLLVVARKQEPTLPV